MKIDFINMFFGFLKKSKMDSPSKVRKTVPDEVLQKNFLKKENKRSPNFEENMARRKHSMIDSQGVCEISGSGYNSNMSHRNYQVRD
ncbi:MAG: hypothetical protein NDI69_04680 [Bacteriovoracaceae bacterium]|nr:hypothetical protein [Bacteriovoracaceae bacterium]